MHWKTNFSQIGTRPNKRKHVRKMNSNNNKIHDTVNELKSENLHLPPDAQSNSKHIKYGVYAVARMNFLNSRSR